MKKILTGFTPAPIVKKRLSFNEQLVRGFTLVELLITSSIFLVIMATIYLAFQTGVFGFRNIEETVDMYQSARQILERMNLDLRNSFAYSDTDTKFIGNKDTVSCLTLVDSFSQDGAAQDYAYILYRLEGNKLIRLCRKNKESLNDKSQNAADEMASFVQGLKFTYGEIVDGSLKIDKDSWNISDKQEEKISLPKAVKVELSLKNKDFQRTIYLPK